jgi:hypothetical protein
MDFHSKQDKLLARRACRDKVFNYSFNTPPMISYGLEDVRAKPRTALV